MVDGSGPLPDSKWELAALIGVVVVVFAGGMVYVQANPGAPWQLAVVYSTVTHNAFSVAGTATVDNTTLRLPAEDAAYLNRQYRELNTRQNDNVGETAFCLFRVGETVRVHKAGTLEADESSIRFTTANCEPRLFGFDVPLNLVGTLHYHPSGRPVLSGPETAVNPEMNDKQSLLSSGDDLSCVMAGLIPEEAGKRPAALKCYTAPASGDVRDVFPEVPVVITE